MSEDKKTSHHSGRTDQFGVRLHNSLKHKIALFGIILLALAIPLTVVLIQQVQDIRQRASEVATPPEPENTPTQTPSEAVTPTSQAEATPTNIPTVTQAVNTPTKTPTNIPTPTNLPTPTPVVLSCTITNVSRTGRQISVRMRNTNLLTSGYDTYRYEFFNARGTKVSTQNKPITSANQLDTFTNVSPTKMVVTARVGNNTRIRPISCGERRL